MLRLSPLFLTPLYGWFRDVRIAIHHGERHKNWPIAPNKWKIKNKLRDGVILWSLSNDAEVNTAWIESTLAYLKVKGVTVEVG